MRRFLTGMKNNVATAGELFRFLAQRKLWFLIPVVGVLIVFALLLVFAQSSGLGALIYPLF
jgi:hypothetical protein